MKTYQSFSSEETQAVGEALGQQAAREVGRRGKSGATVFALTGDLGAGKTTFVQGFFKGLGLKRRAQSPTFILMRRHALARKNGNVYHLDVYRLKEAAQLGVLGMEEILADPRSIVLVEWAERVKKIFPRGTTWIAFRHGKKENERRIIIR